jgi:hypothetical protein
MRYALLLLLLLLPSSLAGDRVDCGIQPGERYWITTAGLVFPDGSVRVDWRNCVLMEGVIFSVLWDEAPAEPSPPAVPTPPAARRYRVESHSDCTGTAEEQKARSQRQAERVRDQLVERGATPDAVELVALGCTRPLVSPEVTVEDRNQNRRVEIILLGP